MRPSRHRHIVPLVVVGLVTSFALTGCFGNPVKDLLEEAASEGSGSSSTSGSSASDDQSSNGSSASDDQTSGGSDDGPSGMDVDTDDGEFNLSFKDLPKDFPESDVPLYNKQVVTSTRIKDEDGTNWMVTLQVSDGQEAFDSAASALESAGYEENSSMDLGAMATNSYTGPTYGVALSVIMDEDKDADDFDILSYTVTDAQD